VPALDSKLRSQLDGVCQKARDLAVAYARSALQKRAVDAAESLSHFGPKEKELRNRLRARGRQVGDVRNADGTQSIVQLSQELAYEYWHRMLFARFLAENHLLMHPDGVAVSLEECEELAPTADPPAPNGFVLAARYASTMLPQIFRTDDVLLEIEFAPEQRLALEKLLVSLPKQTFEADDSLGWVYQFWQSAEKKRVNESGDKIDGRTLPAVTQLFTEHYMVEFLLHNTIGAWWCAKEGIQGPPGGAGIPAGKSPVEMNYLRWRDDGTPAAGKFEGWPKTLAEFTMLDPCCGSGHFLVSGFNLLVPLRIRDEGLSAAEACEAVLRENLLGLELDPRCTQIAAFALALAAWKFPDAGGYRPLPPLNIACSGQSVPGKKDEWLSLANGDERLREGMDRLYDLFQQAPHLGSLIDPRQEKGGLFEAGYAELQPLLKKVLARKSEDAEVAAIGIAAQGIACAADFLSQRYSLIATNVPYLATRKHGAILSHYLSHHHFDARHDISTALLERSLNLCSDGATMALVTPQNWLFLRSYRELRSKLLTCATWNVVARLGEGAFESSQAAGAFIAMVILNNRHPEDGSKFAALDCSPARTASLKASALCLDDLQVCSQTDQLMNPSSVIAFSEATSIPRLSEFAISAAGIGTGDSQHFYRCFWEVQTVNPSWEYLKTTVESTGLSGGNSQIILWEQGAGALYKFAESVRHLNSAAQCWRRGQDVWQKNGVAINCMRELSCTLYDGVKFDQTVVVIVPKNPMHLPALWAFCKSGEFRKEVRQIDQKLNVTSATMVNVPFDIEKWQKESSDITVPTVYESNDPTQWLFKGDIATSIEPLEVAVARLLGYRWPEQAMAEDGIDTLADDDGILCLLGVRGEAAAYERLLEVLHAAYGNSWSDSVLHKLLMDAGSKAGATLDDWLRNQFFEQHCKRFHNRPFIWHIWDGRKDGFSVLVNYHKFTYKALENLTYSYLGDWISAQGKSNKTGADSRLGAAQELQAKLKLILAGEPPYDIFVRWKPIHEQAMGWNPDLNDGVRMNVRPFKEAGILRKNPNIKWAKDRGNEPEREMHDFPWFWSGKEFTGERVNDVHLTNIEKTAARDRKKGAK